MQLVVAVKLDKVIRAELELELLPSTFWSDSQIVLSYIRNERKRFKIFEGDRVSFIRENNKTSEQWQYIPGNLNPSDVASLGCTANMLPNVWYQGPLFLSDHKSAWPTLTSRVSDALSEDYEHIEVKYDSIVSPPVHQAAVNDVIVTDSSQPRPYPLDELINHYSSFYRLKKALCWLVRVMHRPRNGMNESSNEPITVTEMRHAEAVLIKHVQNTSFAPEIRSITCGENVSKSSDIRALNPILFADILVVGGRIRHAPLSKDLRHPVILPLKHRLSDMILLEYHNGAHLGTEWTLSFVQNKYWIPRARNRLKKIRKNCVTCKKLYGRSMQQKMADLSPERSTPDQPPFTNTGLGMFGPFYVRVGRSQAKRYSVIFTCFSTRAIHLEVLHTMLFCVLLGDEGSRTKFGPTIAQISSVRGQKCQGV